MNAGEYMLGAEVGSDQPALVEAQRIVTYGELRAATSQWMAALAEQGEARGARCLLIADNSSAWVAAYLAILKSGLVAVPLSPKIEGPQLAEIIASARPTLAVIGARLWPQFMQYIPEDCSVLLDQNAAHLTGRAVSVRQFARGGLLPTVDVDETRDLAALFFTSGSTGTPRGVMVSHRNLIANTESILAYLNLRHDDRILQVLPMHYCFGASLLHTHLRAGASIVIENNFLFPDRALQTMLATGCTGFAGVPATYQILLRRSVFPRTRFPRLRYLLQAGGKLSSVFIDELRAAQPDARFFVMYGQTEATARLSYLPPELLQAKQGSIGRGIPGVTLRVVDEAGQPVTPGAVGQVIAHGPNIALGYWNAPAETADVFRDGWLYTGDMGTVDPEGFIYLVGRSREFLKLGGTRVACQQIEQVVLRFSGTAEAAVIGMPDEYLGEAAALFVAHPRGEAIQADLVQFLCDHLPPTYRPRKIIFRPDLPLNASGKTDRTALQRLLPQPATAGVMIPAAAMEDRPGPVPAPASIKAVA